MPRYGTKMKPKEEPKRSLLPVGLLLVGLALIAAAILGLAGAGQQKKAAVTVSGAPHLQVEKNTYDYGQVRLGTPVKTDVRVTNTGDQPLRFSRAPYIEVKEGCWPPVPAIGSMVLQPGESTTVSMQYMMHGDMGGPHDFRLHLETNDPGQPEQEVKILSDWVQ